MLRKVNQINLVAASSSGEVAAILDELAHLHVQAFDGVIQ
jgi:hypothetical protein